MAQKPVTPTNPDDPWDVTRIEAHAPSATAVRDARRLLRAGGLGTVEPTADGRGWCARCRDTANYQVTVRRTGEGKFDDQCNCPSHASPCKHALALLFHLAHHPELRAETALPKATAGDFEALLRAVFANPADDTPRLVFADFLDENDQPDRANLIRLQCEQARLRSNSNRYKDLARVINKLVPKVRKQTGVFPFAHHQTGMRYTFRRGFLHLDGHFAQLDMDAVPARFVNLFRDGWVESVRPYAHGGYAFQSSWVPLMAHVAELDLSQNALGEDALLALVAATADARATGRLVRIKVHKRDQVVFDQLMRADRGETVEYAGRDDYRYFNELSPQSLGVLSRAGRLGGAYSLFLEGTLGDADVPTLLAADLSRLAVLDLHDWQLSGAGTAALVRGLSRPDVPLRALDVASCRLEGVARAFVAAHGPAQLETLALGEGSLTDADAVLLATEAGLPNLASLEVRDSPELTAVGVAAILASPRFSKLNALELGATGITAREFVPLLLGAPGRENLALTVPSARGSCSVRNNEVAFEVGWYDRSEHAFFDGLVGCADLKRVTSFTGSHGRIRATEIPVLAAAFDPAKLRCLVLDYNALGADGAAALVRAFAGFALRELSLHRCGLPATGVATIARSPLMATVEKLTLSGNALGKVGLAALLKMNAPGLKEIVLTDCRLTTPENKQLKKHFGERVKL